ncbi:opsin Rh4 isoform X2 [Toxorhynchites rutilus septentrionalis]|uniref:opsin Rh4 isoform X2 n=1 Tax=Toxorhynchites rutilus septentrionalis TaxID=329112 RepID=UPI00247A81BC|nr:opsin Rh4 isoform X2 [Toxorhynchites rutilus septentrionalis]
MLQRFGAILFVLCEMIANISANYELPDKSQILRSNRLPAGLEDATYPQTSRMTASVTVNEDLTSGQGIGSQSHPIEDSLALINASGLWSKYISLSGYNGAPVEEAFRDRINPFWLQFDPPSATAHYILGVIYFIMMLFGLCGNLLVILMFIKFKTLRTPANYLVINLAISDFVIMLEAPLFVYNSFHQGPAIGNTWCTVYALLGAYGGTLAIVTLTMISIDRYNVVVYPLNPNRSTTRLKVMVMIVFSWIYSFIFAAIPAFDVGLSRYTPEGFLTACSFDYLDRSWNARVFMFLYFIFAWVVPFLAITYCYVAILRVVIGANSIQSSKNKNKTEIKLAGVVIGIIGLWFIAWTPYAVVSMLGVFGYESALTPLGSMIPAILAKTAACIDPYFYAMNHPRYRQELRKMFCRGQQDMGNSQYQTSRYNRNASRMGDSEVSERVTIGPKSAADDTSLSVSIDLTESKTTGHH